MHLEIRPLGDSDLPVLHALAAEESLTREFEKLLPDGALADWWKDPFRRTELCQLALSGGTPAGFTLGFVVPAPDGGCWAFVRVGVPGSRRRGGIGSALLARGLGHLERVRGARRLGEIAISAWIPNQAAAGFAQRHGFRHSRYFWRMERPRDLPVLEPDWPPGVEPRRFDGSDAMLRDWNDAYNAAFAEHYHFVPSTPGVLRERIDTHEFRTGAVLLAYRGGACVGFGRDALHGRRGEVALVGVVPEARGLGLGRALLRWGVGWIAPRDTDTVELMVDGENEGALALYRSEAFAVTATRETWSRFPAA